MPNYRRWYVPGGTYFFTVVTYKRKPLFQQENARKILGECFRAIQEELPFETIAIVLLHDHLHALWHCIGFCRRAGPVHCGYAFMHPTTEEP